MAESQNNKDLSVYFFGGIFFLIGVFVLIGLVIVNTQADIYPTPTMSTQITSSPPTITATLSEASYGDAVPAGHGFTLTEGEGEDVYIHGTITDNNGCLDVTGNEETPFYLAFSRSSYLGDCVENGNYCYIGNLWNDSCTFGGGGDTCTGEGDLTVDYECHIALQYWADSTDATGTYPSDTWGYYLQIMDSAGYSDEVEDTGYEVNSLQSIAYAPEIGFGSLGLGEDFYTVYGFANGLGITNVGNVEVDTEMYGEDLTCDGEGTIPLSNMGWSLSDVAFASMSSIPTSAAPVSIDTGLQAPTDETLYDDNAGMDTIYFGIQIPASGVRGTCTGTTTFNTISAI